MGHYEQLEGIAIADAALAIEGEALEDLFETAATALAEVMVDPCTVAPAVDVVDRLDISRKVLSLRPIGNIKG